MDGSKERPITQAEWSAIWDKFHVLDAELKRLRADISELSLEKRKRPKKGQSDVAKVRAAFLESYRKNKGIEYPGWGAKANGQAAQWLKNVTLDDALRLCDWYCRWRDPFIVGCGHDFGLLVQRYVALDNWVKRREGMIADMVESKKALKQAEERYEIHESARKAAGVNTIGRGNRKKIQR